MIRASNAPTFSAFPKAAQISPSPSRRGGRTGRVNLARSKFVDVVAGELREIGWGITRDFFNVGRNRSPLVLFIDCVEFHYQIHLPLRHARLKHSVARSGFRHIDVLELAPRHLGKNSCDLGDPERRRSSEGVNLSFVPIAR